MNIAILGAAGSIGAPIAFFIARLNLFEEIVLIDPKERLLKNHAMDLAQAAQEDTGVPVNVRVGGYEDVGAASIIVNTAAAPSSSTGTRDSWLMENLPILDEIASEIKKRANNQVIVTATNPADVCAYYLYKKTGWDRKKIIGFCRNDSMRIRWALNRATGLDYPKLECMTIGEHGLMQVPLYSQARYDGKPLPISADIMAGSKKAADDWNAEYLDVCDVRTTGWLSCVTMARLISDIVAGNEKPLPVITPLEGEYGERDVALGVPVTLARGCGGIQSIAELPISGEERAQFHAAAEKVRGLIRQTGII